MPSQNEANVCRELYLSASWRHHRRPGNGTKSVPSTLCSILRKNQHYTTHTNQTPFLPPPPNCLASGKVTRVFPAKSCVSFRFFFVFLSCPTELDWIGSISGASQTDTTVYDEIVRGKRHTRTHTLEEEKWHFSAPPQPQLQLLDRYLALSSMYFGGGRKVLENNGFKRAPFGENF